MSGRTHGDHKEERGEKIIFLGSSVTYGASAKGVSFEDYIGKRNQAEVVKEAVSGTTLVDNGANSYISRLKKIKEAQADKIHPTQAGYLEWWTPYMEEKMEEYLADQKSK